MRHDFQQIGSALLWGLTMATPAAAALPCANPAADPCVIGSTVTIPVGVYDIRPKSLSVANKQITVSGAGELKILAGNIVFQPGARFVATGTDGQTAITLDATGTMDIQSQGTSKSKIDVSGNFGGGTINLHSVGNLSVNGTLISSATNVSGYGGTINVTSDTGNVTITGDPSLGLRSLGNAQGGGGTIAIEATLGAVSIATQLVAKGGDCSSCEVDLTAGTDITTTAQGVIDMGASGVGDGGTLYAFGEGAINFAGNILANGSSDDTDGGAGGDVEIDASPSGSVTISGRVELNGAGQDAAPGSLNGSVDGDGGTANVSAGTFIQITGPMYGISKGFGVGDEFAYDTIGNVTLAGEIDMSGDNFPGDITVLSDTVITVSARIRTATAIDPVNKPGSLGGTIDIEGCKINVTPLGQVISTGPGGDPSGANELYAATGLTVAGTLTATAINDLEWRTSPPVITGVVTPAATITQHPELPCCGVSCPITTTTTSTTTTSTVGVPTTTPPTTTSSSTAPHPTTTSSTSTSTSTSSSTSSSTSTSTSTSRPTTTSTSTSSTSTSSTTSTTLVVGCPIVPASGCQTGAKVQIFVSEKTFGKEQVKVKIDKLLGNVPLAFFGDPIAGTTGYAICLYDAADARVATLQVNRPHDQCGTHPCWKAIGGPGYKYTDKLLTSDGMLQLLLKSGPAGSGRFIAKGKNDRAKGQTALPTGIAARLTADRRATVQLMTSNAGCLTGTVDNIRDATGSVFKGTMP